MKKARWLGARDPEKMLTFLTPRVSGRKLRLFACACCRRLWSELPDERSRKAVEEAERFVDARTNQERHQLRITRRGAMAVEADTGGSLAARAARAAVARSYFDAARQASHYAVMARRAVGDLEGIAEHLAQAHLLREICGHLFLDEASFNPRWRTATALSLAEGIYADHAFDRMPILADALEDAGCTNAEILDHCRGPGPHVRGCWAVDLVLGRE